MDFGYSGELWTPTSQGWSQNQEQSSSYVHLNPPAPSSNHSFGHYPCASGHSSNSSEPPLQKTGGLVVPPGYIEDTPKEKPKKRFSRAAVQILEDYVKDNIENPFPTESEKDELAELAGITKCQVSTWFTNTRRRRLKNLKEEVNETRNPRRKLQMSPRKPLAPLHANVLTNYQTTPTYSTHPYNIYPTPTSAMQATPILCSNPPAINMPAQYGAQTPFPGQTTLYNPNYQPVFNTPSPAYPPYDPNLTNDPFLYGNHSSFYY